MFVQVTKLKMYPYFDLAHSALCCLAVREDLATGQFYYSKIFKYKYKKMHSCLLLICLILGSHAFSRKHPLSLWASSMLGNCT